MIGWDIFETKEHLDGFLSDSSATLRERETQITFPCWAFTFAYYDESSGVEIVTLEDLKRMKKEISGTI